MRLTMRGGRFSDDDRSSGFTMIELLLVVVILGILAAVVVFALGSVTGNAKAAACNADAKTIETAVGAFNANPNGTGTVILPETSSVTAAAGAVTIGLPASFYTATNAAALISGNELSTWPQETATTLNNNGYLMSLATVDQTCSSTTAQATCGTSGPSNTNLGLSAKAGQVIVYVGSDFTTAIAGTPATAAKQYTTGVVFDNEGANTGCNLL